MTILNQAWAWVLLVALLSVAHQGFSKPLQLPGDYYVVLYVETDEPDKIQLLLNELQNLPGKVTSAVYNAPTHEFIIHFTSQLRNDTIYQMVLKYFDDFKETDGYYPN